MNLLSILALLTYAFGAYACGAVLLYFGHDLSDPEGRSRSALGRSLRAARANPATLWNWVLLALCLVWFVLLLVETLLTLDPTHHRGWLGLVVLEVSFLFPPLLMHTTLAELELQGTAPRHWSWRLVPRLSWVLCPAAAAYITLAIFEVIPRPLPIGQMIGLGMGGAYSAVGIYCSLALSFGRKREETAAERSGRRWFVLLYLGVILFAAFIYLASPGGGTFMRLLNFLGSTIPLFFIFTALYHESRFQFFDLFVKRAAFFGLCLALLVAFFGIVLPAFGGAASHPWAAAVLLLPGAMALPWLHGRLAAWLDTVWLGRTVRAEKTVQRFVSELGAACTREELVERAERLLGAAFQAPARVTLGAQPGEPGFEVALEVPVGRPAAPVATVRLGRRTNRRPYFSEDIALVDSLADVLAHMLEHVALQERRQEQEARARELQLEASRSELKALRAQIHPHFLFNALNAVAGLIHKDPGRADETLERLSEVFRYTLRGSESEWAALRDELDFARCYLAVENARFGERLVASVTAGADVENLRVPTMLLQTLVENAVKHGIAAVRGPGRIEITARAADGLLVLAVADSGPGFAASAERPAAPDRAARGTGYGLKNVRERLAGHYGDRARLRVERDASRSMTVVSVELPLERHDKMLAAEGAAGSRR